MRIHFAALLLLASSSSPASSASPAAPVSGELKNPFFLQDQAGATQSAGWLGAWTAAPSAYAVAAENSADIVAAVNFAAGCAEGSTGIPAVTVEAGTRWIEAYQEVTGIHHRYV